MSPEPSVKKTVTFVDGQNLFHAARQAFGYTYPNYDPVKLSIKICEGMGWTFSQARFYTGVPEESDDQQWNRFWVAKTAVMGRAGVHIYRRPLRYAKQEIRLPDGSQTTVRIGREKGIDVRIALDVVRLAMDNAYDVAVIFSQDQDLSELADEVRDISKEQNRWIKLASAFPVGPSTQNTRGINKTDWLKIDRAFYDACIDHRDYRKAKL